MIDTPATDFKMSATEHQRMIWYLCKHTYLLEDVLSIRQGKLWVRGIEILINQETQEKADMVFQNKYDSYEMNIPNTTCYVVELKSEKVDHEVLGQLRKSITFFERQKYGFDKVVGVAIGKTFTDSALEMLKNDNVICLIYGEERLMRL